MTLPLRVVGAALLASAQTIFDEASTLFEKAPSSEAFWIMCDLKSSAAFRQAAGEEAAFIRAVGFAQICRLIARKLNDVTVMKELGDAVVLQAKSPKEALEFLVLLDLLGSYAQIDEQLDWRWPSLAIRSAVTYGRTSWAGGENVGGALDRLARASGYRSTRKSVVSVVDPQARAQFERVLKDYPFLKLGDSFQIPPTLLKQGEAKFRLYELSIDRASAADSRDQFAGIRAQF